jgi:hypothetical protein
MQHLPQRIRKIKGIQLVLLFSLVLNVIGIKYRLPSYQGWAPDEVLPRDVKEGIGRGFSHDWFHKYPLFHYYLLALTEAPFLIFAELRGLDFKNVSFYSCLILAGRFLSLFMGAGMSKKILPSLCLDRGSDGLHKRPSLRALCSSAALCAF